LNKLAKAEGLQILDGVGLLETFYAQGYLHERNQDWPVERGCLLRALNQRFPSGISHGQFLS
jgi:hypothetical protein